MYKLFPAFMVLEKMQISSHFEKLKDNFLLQDALSDVRKFEDLL
jgi:hypothetical protein